MHAPELFEAFDFVGVVGEQPVERTRSLEDEGARRIRFIGLVPGQLASTVRSLVLQL